MPAIEIARWNNSDQWIVSVDGDATTDQPRTEAELELSGRFHGPFGSEAKAREFADHYATTLED